MNRYIFTLSFLLMGFITSAQDTSAYQAQRLKINTMLANRSAKFGQYDESLAHRSGIFGWQTKKDIKNSNEILRQVVLTDNDIFTELKALMEYKDLQNQQKVEVADNSEQRLDNYMRTIKKLQDQNAQLKKDLQKNGSGQNLSFYFIAFLILVMAGGSYFFYKKLHKYEKTVV